MALPVCQDLWDVQISCEGVSSCNSSDTFLLLLLQCLKLASSCSGDGVLASALRGVALL